MEIYFGQKSWYSNPSIFISLLFTAIMCHPHEPSAYFCNTKACPRLTTFFFWHVLLFESTSHPFSVLPGLYLNLHQSSKTGTQDVLYFGLLKVTKVCLGRRVLKAPILWTPTLKVPWHKKVLLIFMIENGIYSANNLKLNMYFK